jgi:hypothetical protein
MMLPRKNLPQKAASAPNTQGIPPEPVQYDPTR